jgi:type I restriction enzyme R subunit
VAGARLSTSSPPEGDFAAAVDDAVLRSKPDSWAGDTLKERKVKLAIKAALPADFDRLDELLELVRARDEYR